MVLSLALAYVFFFLEKKKTLSKLYGRWIFLACAIGLFVYFFPVLSGGKVLGDEFRYYMWFTNWI
jgi:dolichyl-phosphate-mannose--protein O-mannosyl transferase